MFGKDTPNIVRWIAQTITGLIIAISLCYLCALYYANRNSQLVSLNRQPIVLDAKNFAETNNFAPGDSTVFVFDVTKREIGCFAEYVVNFSGPVNFQVPVGKSFVFPAQQSETRAVIKSLVVLPSIMPNGVYATKLIAYPVCSGWDMDPYTVGPAPALVIESR